MIVMLFVLSDCFRAPIPIFRTPEYEFRTLSGCAVKMYQICRFVLYANTHFDTIAIELRMTESL